MRPILSVNSVILIASLTAAGALGVGAQTVLSSGHVDIGIGYEDGAFDLHVHKELPGPEQEFESDEVVLRIGAQAALPGGVPNIASAVAFFGAAGSPLWVLPKTENPDLLFLGIGAEELEADDWTGSLTLSLMEVEGPGDFFLWDTDPLGDLLPLMSSRDGITLDDRLDVIAGSHGHYFLGFSAPGDYEVSLRASGVHTLDGAVISDSVAYAFSVVPEPGPMALLALGATAVWLSRRKQCRP